MGRTLQWLFKSSGLSEFYDCISSCDRLTFVLFFQAKRKLELDVQNEGFKTPAKYKRQRSSQSPKGIVHTT